jgi:hypothetical protein
MHSGSAAASAPLCLTWIKKALEALLAPTLTEEVEGTKVQASSAIKLTLKCLLGSRFTWAITTEQWNDLKGACAAALRTIAEQAEDHCAIEHLNTQLGGLGKRNRSSIGCHVWLGAKGAKGAGVRLGWG